ncbi:MAG: glycosyltransferase family 4 protein [Crenarchaeota archaeon]|nr:glycosyltransferase family 4 protein [Thermoproteota archaeon]
MKARILIIHHSFNSCGGGERVALHLIKLLQDSGYEVMVGTTEKTDWTYVQNVIGIRLRKIPREYYISPIRLRAFGIYQRPLTTLHIARLRDKVDLVVNTHGDVTLLPADITYLHFPVIAYMKLGYLRFYFKYMKSPFWYLYFRPYYEIQTRHAKKCFYRSIVVTNSNFSKSIIRKVIGKNSFVVYPPTELHDYIKILNMNDREDAVIYIARFSPEKNNHLLVHIAKELPEYQFYLVGSAHGRGVEYYNYCLKLAERLNVKNIKIMANVPHETKLKLLASCKVYVHLFPTEHFGIAPLEALASGLVPVVPKLSGTWTDICLSGRFGVGYENLDVKEVSEKIMEAFERYGKYSKAELLKHLEQFSPETFYRKMRRIFEIALERCSKK